MKRKNAHTKFPLAKIKKIIQQNEDIGKVSHSIPFLIAKSLEVFLREIVSKSADIAKETGSAKLTPSHLKKVIEEEQKFEFLQKITEEVPSLSGTSKIPVKAKTDKKIRKGKDANQEDIDHGDKIMKKIKGGMHRQELGSEDDDF